MEPKDWRYDPTINDDSGSDSEPLNNDNIMDKLSPPSSPTLPVSWGMFVHNDLRSHGGPQADAPDDTKEGGAEATKECCYCRRSTRHWYSGCNYKCHTGTEADEKHNKLCKGCAQGDVPPTGLHEQDRDHGKMRCYFDKMGLKPKARRAIPPPRVD